MPPPTICSILMLPSHLTLCLQNGLLHSTPHTKSLYAPLLSPIPATCPVPLILLDLITQITLGTVKIVKLLDKPSSPVLCHFVSRRPRYLPQPPVFKQPQPTSFPQCESLNLTLIQKKAQTYIRGAVLLLLSDSKLEDKRSWTERPQALSEITLFLISS